jgi:hypothetical protein
MAILIVAVSPSRLSRYMVAPDGHALPSQQELSLRVFVKDAGVWQIAAFHNTMVAPLSPPLK